MGQYQQPGGDRAIVGWREDQRRSVTYQSWPTMYEHCGASQDLANGGGGGAWGGEGG